MFARYAKAHPELAAEFTRRHDGALPDNWSDVAASAMAAAAAAGASMATRKASQAALEALAPALPELLGGSADLTGSNNTFHSASVTLTREQPGGNYINFGVREFGMTAIGNGLQLHGGVRPYSGTFLTFSDYARNAVRMAALMACPNILVYTHDSIGLGEDGPTHQPIEHVASLRLIPNLDVWRPADTVETMAAWISAIEQRSTPTALVLTRQTLSFVERTKAQMNAIERGGYVLRECGGAADIVLLASGSEVGLIVDAAAALRDLGVAARVVSMPCCERFASQPAAWRDEVLGAPGTPRLAVEAGVSDYWWRWVGDRGDVIGIDRFGESAPAAQLFEKYGFSVSNVVQRAKRLLAND